MSAPGQKFHGGDALRRRRMGYFSRGDPYFVAAS
jgi:hypothetical protein